MHAMGKHLFVRMDPGNWYPLEMSLRSRSREGFLDGYVIACRRTEDMGISDTSSLPYLSPEPRMGEWEQPISHKVFSKILGMLENATIPRSRALTMLDGPPLRQYLVEFEAIRIGWQAYVLDDSVLSQVIRLMVDAVERPVPVVVPFVRKGLAEDSQVM